jgi:hypothetical protein
MKVQDNICLASDLASVLAAARASHGLDQMATLRATYRWISANPPKPAVAGAP